MESVVETYDQPETQWFRERKEMLRMEQELAEHKHKMKMEELEFERASHRLTHEQILERGRIQRAEEKKMLYERIKAR